MTATDTTAAYLDLAVAAHMAPTIIEQIDAERAAARVARVHGLDEMALEDAVLTRVFAAMTDAELHRAVADPSRRARARAEITRRATQDAR